MYAVSSWRQPAVPTEENYGSQRKVHWYDDVGPGMPPTHGHGMDMAGEPERDPHHIWRKLSAGVEARLHELITSDTSSYWWKYAEREATCDVLALG